MGARKSADLAERRFSIEEVGGVIRTASMLARRDEGTLPVRASDTMSFAELCELAAEMGIDEDALRRAIPEAEAMRTRAEKRARRKLRFWRHLFTFLVVNGGLALPSLLQGHGVPSYVLLMSTFWGMGLCLHGLGVYVTGKGGVLHRKVLAREIEAERRLP